MMSSPAAASLLTGSSRSGRVPMASTSQKRSMHSSNDVYRMTVHVFGSVSSPSSCLYALRRVAEDNQQEFPEAAACVKSSFYVDDCAHSVPTAEEAIELIQQLTRLLGKGGFHLTKWVSSSKQVLATVPASERSSPLVNFEMDGLPVEKTLGMLWDAET